MQSLPEAGGPQRYTCNYFNYQAHSNVPLKGLFDFASNYHKHVKSELNLRKQWDMSVYKALEVLPPGQLEAEKRAAGISRQIYYPKNQLENKSSETDGFAPSNRDSESDETILKRRRDSSCSSIAIQQK